MSQSAPKDDKIDAKKMRFAVCRTRWNASIVEKIAELTAGELSHCNAIVESLPVCDGVFELAPLVARVARKGGVDGIIAIGCVIRGETDHYSLLANETTRALGSLALELATSPRPIALTFGVLAVNDEAQARARIENGREFARTCIKQAFALKAVE
jgi:6,7-dimethyl-8-ribityllumazine synthase